MRIIGIAVLALALASCSAVDDEASGEPGSERADGELQMAAGKWSQTLTIQKFELPGAPPEVEQMLQQMVGNEQTSESCMTQDEVARGFEEQAKQSMKGKNCNSENFSAKGGKLMGKVVCKEPNGAAVNMAIDGKYTPNQMDMTMTADITDPSMPGGKGKMVMTIAGKRLGECDA